MAAHSYRRLTVLLLTITTLLAASPAWSRVQATSTTSIYEETRAPAHKTFLNSVKAIPVPEGADTETWVFIDLISRELHVFRGRERLKTIPHVAIGTAGVERIRTMGSHLTPVGEFRVDQINRQSRFNTFFGIDYPTPEIVQDAHKAGLLSDRDYQRYTQHRKRYNRTLHHTALGGNIGIHGLGRRNPEVHRVYDWTEGCLAVNNSEIKELSQWIDLGTRVVLHD
ncbi:L,D-transpeptidase [Vreelandella rituensis]|uniref:Murein L,D-transpeptidase n=1 Tax=Vreelandella rituensis TaxID=2282306 RepID=A0A368UA89_9GAMM|nr:L,D-transpeptidase [Halomonas rituensis]RCV93911.1 murein L,D-transpeptidase [Halomonas rituensis]